jgi:Fe-S-cluster containining protein
MVDPWSEWLTYWRDGGEENPDAKFDETLRFIGQHMTEVGRSENIDYQCDFFNHETRLCEAHELRPPMCSGYPFYPGRTDAEVAKLLYSRCSYGLDVSPSLREPGSRPLIPVTVKGH